MGLLIQKGNLHFVNLTKGVFLTILIGVGIDEVNGRGETALHLACLASHEECTEILLENGAIPDIFDNQGEMPLHKVPRVDNSIF